jgi:tetratricopeptide (TPR) repeat protein
MKRRIALGILLLASPITERALAQPPAAADPPIVFSKDIAPILYRHCAACHRPNGPAPFSLITYDDARTRAAQIATATARRYMPPWKPQPGYGDFVGERRLSDTEIVSLRRWATSGRLEGDLKDLPSPPRFSSGWSLGEPDLVVSLPEYQLRAGGPDVFRNFVVPVPASATRYVGALEFRPGSRAVHHANIRVDPTPASRRLDDDDPVPGYEGVILRSADYPDGHFLGWTPGQLPSPGPNALAWRLEAGVDFVVQLHLQPTGKQERIVPSIGLYFAKDAPVRTPAILRLGRQNLEIPAGWQNVHVVDAYLLPVDAEIRAIQPHAHYRARRVSATAVLPDGVRRPLIIIQNWDFNWQDQYRYATPFWVPAGTRLEMDYTFDNSDTNPRNPIRPLQRAFWGWRSFDEMADLWIQVLTRTDADRERLVRDVRRKMAAEDAIGCETLIARQPEHVDLRNDAASLYLELGRPADALKHFEAVARLRPQSAQAHYNVGVALEGTGRVGEAARAYETAVRLDPAYSHAHNNLGSLLLSAGRLDDARRAFERAVESASDNVEAANNLGAVLLALGDVAAALPHLTRAIELRPTYPEAHFNLARAFASTRQPEAAMREAAVAESQASAAGKPALVAQIRELRDHIPRR